MASRELEREGRLLRDQQKAQTRAAAASTGNVIATVSGISPGAAGNGSDLVSVTWLGGEVTAAGYARGSTFAVGDRVKCTVIDHQLLIDYPIDGAP